MSERMAQSMKKEWTILLCVCRDHISRMRSDPDPSQEMIEKLVLYKKKVHQFLGKCLNNHPELEMSGITQDSKDGLYQVFDEIKAIVKEYSKKNGRSDCDSDERECMNSGVGSDDDEEVDDESENEGEYNLEESRVQNTYVESEVEKREKIGNEEDIIYRTPDIPIEAEHNLEETKKDMPLKIEMEVSPALVDQLNNMNSWALKAICEREVEKRIEHLESLAEAWKFYRKNRPQDLRVLFLMFRSDDKTALHEYEQKVLAPKGLELLSANGRNQEIVSEESVLPTFETPNEEIEPKLENDASLSRGMKKRAKKRAKKLADAVEIERKNFEMEQTRRNQAMLAAEALETLNSRSNENSDSFLLTDAQMETYLERARSKIEDDGVDSVDGMDKAAFVKKLEECRQTIPTNFKNGNSKKALEEVSKISEEIAESPVMQPVDKEKTLKIARSYIISRIEFWENYTEDREEAIPYIEMYRFFLKHCGYDHLVGYLPLESFGEDGFEQNLLMHYTSGYFKKRASHE